MSGMTLDPGLMIWTLLTFGGLFLLLGRFAFKPLRRLLEEREQKIQASLDRARQVREEAEQALARNERTLDEARQEVRRIVDEGHRLAAQMKREAQDAARTEAEQIIGQARVEIQREAQRSLDELKNAVADLSVRISRQVLQEELNAKRHAQLTEEFIEKLKKTDAIHKS
jgi:F-type H+-transporting ATPase subunit b